MQTPCRQGGKGQHGHTGSRGPGQAQVRACLGSTSPHLDQVELGEEAQAPGHGLGRGAALLDHVVDGRLHVVEQLVLQEGEQAAAPS